MNELALIIEDDQDLSKIFSKALQAAGYKTQAILDGLAAQQHIAEAAPGDIPKLVVLDIHLPRVSGEKLLAQIRREEKFRDTYVVVATSDALMAEDMRGVADFVLVKPTTFAQLRDFASHLRRIWNSNELKE